jgi:hypothetical protein
MSKLGPRDFDAILRDALHAEAASIEPQGRGFDQIASRLRRPLPLPLAWLMPAWSYLALRIPEYLDGLVEITRIAWQHSVAAGRWLAAAWRAAERYLPGPANRHGKPSRLGWLRPVAVMTFAIIVITAGVYAAIDVSQGIAPSSGGPGSGHSQPVGHSSHAHSTQPSSGGPHPTGTGSLGKDHVGTQSRCGTGVAKTTSPSSPAPVVPVGTSPGTSSPSPSTSPTSPSPTPTSSSPSPSPTTSSASTSPPAAAASSAATTTARGLGRTADRSAARIRVGLTSVEATSGKTPCAAKSKHKRPSAHASALGQVQAPSISLPWLDEPGVLPATKARLG